MSAPGHCRHCRDGCTLGDTCEFCHVNENWTAAWDDECCPVCDEAIVARVVRYNLVDVDTGEIAAKCIEWAEGCYQRGEDDAVRELNEMADFARGDR